MFYISRIHTALYSPKFKMTATISFATSLCMMLTLVRETIKTGLLLWSLKPRKSICCIASVTSIKCLCFGWHLKKRDYLPRIKSRRDASCWGKKSKWGGGTYHLRFASRAPGGRCFLYKNRCLLFFFFYLFRLAFSIQGEKTTVLAERLKSKKNPCASLNRSLK